MLRRDRDPKQGCFADQARAVRSVPDDHVLMRMRRAVDWEAVETELARHYERWTGRPSWPPAVLVRMLVLEQFADLSDRDVHEQVGYNLLYRSFVGLGADDPVPDDTTLVRFRARAGESGIREIFEVLNRQWEEAGLIGTDRRVLDGSHLWAKVARRSWVGLMRKGRELVVEAVEQEDPERGQVLREKYVVPAVDPEDRTAAGLRAEKERTAALLSEVRDTSDERVRERAALVESLLGEGDRVVSFHDPDARWGHKGPDKPFCGYKTHEAMDPESRLITSVDVVPGNANEAVRVDKLLREDTAWRDEGAVVIADQFYNTRTTMKQVKEAGARPCFRGLRTPRVSDAFEYDASSDQMVCSEGKRSRGKARLVHGDQYYFSVKDCRECPKKSRCLTPGERKGSSPRRRVFLSDVVRMEVEQKRSGKAWRENHLKVRRRIESKFDEQMNRHGLRKARYWGLSKVTIQVLLNVITVNAKRAVKLLAQRGDPTTTTVMEGPMPV